jgi:hypothetical protein
VKNKKVTYNPKGLKRTDNLLRSTQLPQKDIDIRNVKVEVKDNYWLISDKK